VGWLLPSTCVLVLLPLAGARADAAAGHRIATGGNAAGTAPACASCHGEHGEGQASGAGVFPRLAGLDPAYLAKQIDDFRQGRRVSEVMRPVAEALTPEETTDVAAYYGALRGAPPAPPPRADAGTSDLGRRLATLGKWDAGVPPCQSCHGPDGVGVAPAFPYLAGQLAAYAAKQLADWKDGRRRNDPLGLMQAVALPLDEGEAAAVAAYFQSLRPPPRQGEP
jgi:cytochrome c553